MNFAIGFYFLFSFLVAGIDVNLSCSVRDAAAVGGDSVAFGYYGRIAALIYIRCVLFSSSCSPHHTLIRALLEVWLDDLYRLVGS